ncbi:MAG: hypothetical protein E7I57_01565 [Anaerococcus vaginalis]|uniref:hypothetical protein n=1 Tax=Anaerococcus TaxID=165779 RepID=UPI0029106F0F|nr:hypothetical protein [Anaerococcus vaginalis]MDU4378115.1 hypothetical protein [Anaerococcus vaginalis]
MKRSEKYRNFKEFGLPRYLMISEKDKKRECILWIILSVMFLLLALNGRNEIQKYVGVVLLFVVNLVGVLSR